MLLLLLDDSEAIEIPYPTENSASYIDDHKATAISQLLQEFQQSEKLKGLLCAFAETVQTSEDLMNPLVLSRDLDVAIGDVLDSLGDAVGEPRQGRGDGVYRLFVRAKILVNKSSGTIPEIIAIVRQMAGDPLIDVQIDEYYPATFFVRPVDVELTETEGEIWGDLLRLAKGASIRMQFVYNLSPETQMFQFGATEGVIGNGHGLDEGHLAGDA